LQEKNARSIVKSLTYRLTIVVLDITVIYILTGRLDAALGFALISNIYTTVAYYFHERIWNKIGWGKTKKTEIAFT
jgi:uncharacterized membrane protein